MRAISRPTAASKKLRNNNSNNPRARSSTICLRFFLFYFFVFLSGIIIIELLLLLLGWSLPSLEKAERKKSLKNEAQIRWKHTAKGKIMIANRRFRKETPASNSKITKGKWKRIHNWKEIFRKKLWFVRKIKTLKKQWKMYQ